MCDGGVDSRPRSLATGQCFYGRGEEAKSLSLFAPRRFSKREPLQALGAYSSA